MVQKEYDVSREALNLPEDGKDIHKVVHHDVRKKNTTPERLSREFLGGDLKTVGDNIVSDVVIPAAKNMMSDIVHTIGDVLTGGADRLLFGSSSGGGSYYSSGIGNRRSYVSYDRKGNSTASNSMFRGAPNSGYSFDQYIIESRAESEAVLSEMYRLLEQYKIVTVSDFKSILGVSATHVDNEWGWTDLRGSCTRQVRQGYILDLPEPVAVR